MWLVGEVGVAVVAGVEQPEGAGLLQGDTPLEVVGLVVGTVQLEGMQHCGF